jgi:Tol biopolymer transport system component
MAVRVDGTGLRRLAPDSRSGSPAAWAPDGRRIAYVSDASIYLMDADGTGKRVFVNYGLAPAWQPTR